MHPTAKPKMLPWLARKAGVSDARAEALWHSARRFATRLAKPGTPAWSKLATHQLVTSLDAEAARHARHAGLNALWLLPARLWLLAAEAGERAALSTSVSWRGQQRLA